MMPTNDEKPCPFCGYPRSRLVSRTEYRENADGLTATFTEFDWQGFESGELEVKMLDFRHVFYRRCNKCGARGPLVSTDWHVRTQEEADDFSFGSKLWPFGPDSEWARPWREEADAEWNRRSADPERTCMDVNGFCSVCGEGLDDGICSFNYCAFCGAKVVDE